MGNAVYSQASSPYNVGPMMEATASQDQALLWQRSARTFSRAQSPMRPVEEDLAHYWETLTEWMRIRGTPRVLLLGVTPELYSLPWPKGTDLLAVDSSRAMIEAVWPGPRDAIRFADWLSLDLPKGSRDIVLCDGGLHLLSYPHGQHALIRFMHQVLSDEGLCISRLFVMPPLQETPDAVIHDLCDRKIADQFILKLRLLMSLQASPEEGIELGRAYDALIRVFPDLAGLASRVGWVTERMLNMENFKGLQYKYYFLTLDQTIGMFQENPGGFRLHRVQTPSYPLGHCCPTLSLQRLSREAGARNAASGRSAGRTR